ncbi:MAG: thioredoxin domain-containing protein [Desulfobacteraceae bacterium]|nr:thioredoxin domain-containing protein [Desulfobacteraceae bacterium]MBC2756590.1 thioredoxin domain-containing protein [Desulfobacteraceae bacterium]
MTHTSATAADKSAGSFFYLPQPGARAYDKDLIKKLAQVRKLRGQTYQPRTKHLQPDGWAKYTNRLFLESSPYLLQHAHNPVNWYPWGDEAFETAKQLNRPVFLSVGYSTCHWCHVMEEESFEDEEIARYLNENYVCVKVDREERPDIDSIYMTAVQALTGRGGWPMSVWLTADRKPFYGGTYFPPRDGDRGANIGFLTILEKLNQSFHAPDGRVENAGLQITAAIQKMMETKPGNRLPEKEVLQNATTFYRQSYDRQFGGLAGAPKFPSSLPIRFLLRYYRQPPDKITQGKNILEMIEHSLAKMAGGGMYDHVGGGFHRYATDEHWLVPHFEKMLYDNALLAVAYLEAYQATGNDEFKRVVNDILRYVSRDMISPDGAFYSATDADSMTPEGHMEEGWYFTWTPDELESVLGKDRAKIVKKYYSVTMTPNFEGRHILHTEKTTDETAAALNMTKKELFAVIDESRELLYTERNKRPAPLRDEKILTSWNALMISAFARAGLVFNDPDYIDQATKAARFIMDHLYKNNRLQHSYKDNNARHNAFLDDYAFFIAALIDLYEATHDIHWLEKALELDDVLKIFYEDPETGGFFMTSTDHENLIAREKPYYDSAIPSGNAVSVLNLLRLHSFTTDYRYKQRAEKAIKSFSKRLSANPAALSEMLLAIDYFLDDPKEIILILPDGKPEAGDSLLETFRNHFIPNRILVVADETQTTNLAEIIPLAGGKKAINGKATAYVCENGTCKLPTSDPKEFAVQLQQ